MQQEPTSETQPRVSRRLFILPAFLVIFFLICIAQLWSVQIANPSKVNRAPLSRPAPAPTGDQLISDLKRFGRRIKRKVTREFRASQEKFDGWKQ